MKKFFVLLVLLTITVNTYAVDLHLTIGDSSMSINNENKTIKAPIEENGMTLVPVRVITEAFGADVKWNESEQSVVVTKGDKKLWLVINNKTAKLNDEKIELLTAPKLLDDTTMVPIRLISEMLNCKVSYNDATREIFISDENKVSWSMNVPEEFLVDNRKTNVTVYYTNDMSRRITVGVYKKLLSENLENAVEKHELLLKEKYKGKTKTGERIENGLRKGTISYSYDSNGISFKGFAQIFFSNNVKYVLEIYTENDDLSELEEITKSFKFEATKEELPEEYNENYTRHYAANSYKFNSTDIWEIEKKDDITSIIKDDINGFEITLDFIDYNEINDDELLAPFGLMEIGVFKVKDLYPTMCKNIYNKKEGIPAWETKSNGVGNIVINNQTIQIGTNSSHRSYKEPDMTENFYNKIDVYIFDIDDRSVEYREKNGRIDSEKFDMLIKDRICYVFYIDNCLMIADCKISDCYTYHYNRYIYDNIIKSLLKQNN